VTWGYEVSKHDPFTAANVVVTDDHGTPGDSSDDFHPSPVSSGGFNVGDDNQNGLLDDGETWLFEATGTAETGPYANVATATADRADADGTLVEYGGSTKLTQMDGSNYSDPSHYLGVQPLALAAPAIVSPPATQSLEAEAVAEVLDAAIHRFATMAVDEEVQQLLRSTIVEVADLPGDLLGFAAASTIVIDVNACGYGWFVDATPDDDAEFHVANGRFVAADDQPAAGRVDLLTVLAHELGHILGGHDLHGEQRADLMFESLGTGERKLPWLATLERILAENDS
jgi:hypothetical protein